MPRLVSEVSSGASFSRRGDDKGLISDTQTRTFKIVLQVPDEPINVQQACGVFVGSLHPTNTWLYCESFDVRFDGESRMVLIATFSYKSFEWPEDEQTDRPQPGTRLANWSTSTSLMEVPVYTWRKRTALLGWEGGEKPAVNPAGDIYEAVSKLTGMVNITITQETVGPPPLHHNQYSGYINREEISLGQMRMKPHTVMFRGVQIQPFAETFNEIQYRGWRSSYEFVYKPNNTKVMIGGVEQEVELGWDIAVPQTGFNVIAFEPNLADNTIDNFGQPLQHGDAGSDDSTLKQFAGRIVEPLKLATGISAGDRARAMVKVFSYQGGGASQAPSASPIPLNDNGRPRNQNADPKVLVYGYQVQPDVNFTTTFSLRLRN